MLEQTAEEAPGLSRRGASLHAGHFKKQVFEDWIIHAASRKKRRLPVVRPREIDLLVRCTPLIFLMKCNATVRRVPPRLIRQLMNFYSKPITQRVSRRRSP